MDLSDIGSGLSTISRRRLVQAAILTAGGATAAATSGEWAAGSLKDETNDDEADETAEIETESGGDRSKPDDPDGKQDHTKTVVSQIDLTERDGRVTIRLGAYERVVADFNRNGEAVGDSAWRVDGARAARGGVSFRARDDDTVELTLQNPTPIPYSLSVRTGEPDDRRLTADSYGVTVYAGGVERLVLDDLTQGAYSYLIETPTRPIEPLAGRLLVDHDPTEEDEPPSSASRPTQAGRTYFSPESNTTL